MINGHAKLCRVCVQEKERGAAESAIKAMEGTLKGAKVTAATLQRNDQRARHDNGLR